MTRVIAILLGAQLLSACATQPFALGDCPDPQSVDKVIISYQQQNNMVKLQAAPNRIEVDSGDLIEFQINGNLGKVVSVAGKNTASDWISGNATAGSFFVCVDPDAAKDAEYRYMVNVVDIGELDPEVRIRP